MICFFNNKDCISNSDAKYFLPPLRFCALTSILKRYNPSCNDVIFMPNAYIRIYK